MVRPVLEVVQSRSERAVAAQCTEDHAAGFGDRAGVAGRAGHRGGVLVDGEVVDGEPALDRRGQRPGLDHRVVSGVVDRATQIPCAVSGIAVPLTRAGGACGSRRIGGQELLCHRRIGVLRTRRPWSAPRR